MFIRLIYNWRKVASPIFGTDVVVDPSGAQVKYPVWQASARASTLSCVEADVGDRNGKMLTTTTPIAALMLAN